MHRLSIGQSLVQILAPASITPPPHCPAPPHPPPPPAGLWEPGALGVSTPACKWDPFLFSAHWRNPEREGQKGKWLVTLKIASAEINFLIIEEISLLYVSSALLYQKCVNFCFLRLLFSSSIIYN